MNEYIILLIIILSGITIVIMIATFCNATSYHGYIEYEQTISYGQFKAIYSTVPEKWEIIDDPLYSYLQYRDSKKTYIIFMKKYFDYLRLKQLIKRRDKQSADAEYDKIRSELIKLWQHDISSYYEKILKKLRKELGDEVQSYS